MEAQVERLREALKERKINGMTGLEMITELGILNYKGRVHDLRVLLREEGNTEWIRTDMIKVKNRFGEDCRVASYTLVQRRGP